MKKHLFLPLLSLVLLLSIPNLVSANEELENREEYTIAEAESLLVNYLKENSLNSEVGSPEFTGYVLKQEYENADSKLMEEPYYGVIAAYISEYVYAYETSVGISDETSEEQAKEMIIEALEPLEEKTIEQIEDEIKTQEESQIISLPKTTQITPISVMSESVQASPFQMMEGADYTATAFSVSKAKTYAGKWWNSRNSFQYDSEDNDCTNFVSQILFASGKSKKAPSSVPAGTSRTTSYWYSYINDSGKVPTFKKTTSWINVSDFYSFWNRTQATKASTNKQTLIDYADEGDVIQFRKKNDPRFSHTMFVYEKSGGTLYLSGHTSNYLKRNFKDISTDWVEYRVIKF